MKKIWHDCTWKKHEYWQTQDKKTLKKINLLLKDIERNGEQSGILGIISCRGHYE